MLRRIAAVGRRVEISFPLMTPTGHAELKPPGYIVGKPVPETELQAGAIRGRIPRWPGNRAA